MAASFKHDARFRTLLGELMQVHAEQVAALQLECLRLRQKLESSAVEQFLSNDEAAHREPQSQTSEEASSDVFTPRPPSLADHDTLQASSLVDHGTISTRGREQPGTPPDAFPNLLCASSPLAKRPPDTKPFLPASSEAEGIVRQHARRAAFDPYKIHAEWHMDGAEQARIMEKYHERTMFAIEKTSSVLSRVVGKNGFKEQSFVFSGKCIHPDSKPRILWDVISMLFLCYDAIFLPLQVFDLAVNVLTKVMEYLGVSFWSLDILASSATGMYVKGVLVLKRSSVALRYAKTWLSLDLVLVTLDWISIVLGHQNYRQTYLVLRVLRIMRLLRLVRLIKLGVLVKNLVTRINSIYWLLGLSVLKTMLILALMIHIIANFWCFVAKANDDKGWLGKNDLESSSPWYQYLVSLQWATAIFHGSPMVFPASSQEIIFACVMVLLGLISVSYLVGSVTNGMLELQTLQNEQTQQCHMLRKYLADRMISVDLSSQVKQYLEHRMGSRWQAEQGVTILQQLPHGLRMKLQKEAHFPSLMSSLFFDHVCAIWPQAAMHICHAAVVEVIAGSGETIFSLGCACTRVLVVLRGEIMYYLNKDQDAQSNQMSKSMSKSSPETSAERGVSILDSQWISEPVLWTKWECCGSLCAQTDSVLLAIDGRGFSQAVCQYEMVHLMAARYARYFVDELSKGSHELSDLKAFSIDADLISDTRNIKQSEEKTSRRSLPSQVLPRTGTIHRIGKMFPRKVSRASVFCTEMQRGPCVVPSK